MSSPVVQMILIVSFLLRLLLFLSGTKVKNAVITPAAALGSLSSPSRQRTQQPPSPSPHLHYTLVYLYIYITSSLSRTKKKQILLDKPNFLTQQQQQRNKTGCRDLLRYKDGLEGGREGGGGVKGDGREAWEVKNGKGAVIRITLPGWLVGSSQLSVEGLGIFSSCLADSAANLEGRMRKRESERAKRNKFGDLEERVPTGTFVIHPKRRKNFFHWYLWKEQKWQDYSLPKNICIPFQYI